MSREAMEQMTTTAAAKTTTLGSYATAGLNLYFGMTINEWCLVIGAFCALGTFVVNWWYKRREDRRAELLLRLQMPR